MIESDFDWDQKKKRSLFLLIASCPGLALFCVVEKKKEVLAWVPDDEDGILPRVSSLNRKMKIIYYSDTSIHAHVPTEFYDIVT